MKHGKKYRAIAKSIEMLKAYPLEEAVQLVKKASTSKFVGSVEIAIKTFANPKYNDQMLRGTTVLPHGTGKTVKIAVFVWDDQQEDAKKAGADIVGYQDLLKKIEGGEIDFDIIVTTNEYIRDMSKVAKVLGPKGMMPSPKAGTVTSNLKETIGEIKKGRVEFKLDKTGNVHCVVGKLNFTEDQLKENVEALLKALEENKPSGIKGKLVKKVVLAPTMGPGVMVAY